ncbi:hypothetical protein SMJ63A_30146 [Stenotrophomonas geniculata]
MKVSTLSFKLICKFASHLNRVVRTAQRPDVIAS